MGTEVFQQQAKRDILLVQKALLNNDQKAYAELYNYYKDSLHSMLLKMTNNPEKADDLTIESFVQAFKNLHQYTPDYAFSTWLFKIASNHCIDYIHKSRQIQFDTDVLLENIEDGDSDQLDQIIKKEKINLISDVINKLKPQYRELIELRYLNDYSYKEIADELSLPIATVRARLFRARELIFSILKKETSLLSHEKGDYIDKNSKIITSLDASIFLDTNDSQFINDVEYAFNLFLAEFGFSLLSTTNPIFSSWFKKFKIKLKEFQKRPDVEKRMNEIEYILRQQAYLKPQSEIDKNQAEAVSKLLISLENIPNAAIKIGSILLIKLERENKQPLITIRTLNIDELIYLEKNPNLLNKPHEILNNLLIVGES